MWGPVIGFQPYPARKQRSRGRRIERVATVSGSDGTSLIMTLEPVSALNEMQPIISFSDVFYRTVRVPFAIAWPALQWERILHFVTRGFVLFGAWFRSWWIPCNRLQCRGSKRGLQKEYISPEIFWIKVSTFSIPALAFYMPPPPSTCRLGANSEKALIIK